MIRGLTPAGPLRTALGISQPTLSRWVAHAGRALLVVGARRSTRYAAFREIAGLDNRIPVFEVTREGNVEKRGELAFVHPRGSVFFPLQGSPMSFDGLPFFLTDLRQQGFLGRAFANRHSELNLPQRLSEWSDDQHLLAMATRGINLSGSLLVGEAAFNRLHSRGEEGLLFTSGSRSEKFPNWAMSSLQGAEVGSSAGGEQPKFLATLKDDTGGVEDVQVLVKFSPPIDDGDAALRWADLLFAEHHALNVLGRAEVSVSSSRCQMISKRVYLELERFDRVGRRGRRGVLSLASLSDEFVGRRDDWSLVARELEQQGWISNEDLSRVRFLDCFGEMIGNTDRHFGNLSFFWDFGASRARLAPVYDMLPMLYAPVAGSQIVERELGAVPPRADRLEEWKRARPWAQLFWKEIAESSSFSAGFRKTAAQNANILG